MTLLALRPSPSPASPPPVPPRPLPDPPLGPGPRITVVRVLRQGGRYLLAYAVVGWSVYWLADIHLFVPGLLIAAMLANPWRPKRPPRPARAGSGSGVIHFPLRLRAWRAGLLSQSPG